MQYFSLLNQTDPSQLNDAISINDLAMSTVVNGVLVESKNIPQGLQNIVNFILTLVSAQVKQTCGQCLASTTTNLNQGQQAQPATGTLVNLVVTPNATTIGTAEDGTINQTVIPLQASGDIGTTGTTVIIGGGG